MKRHPQGFGRALSAFEFYLSDTKEIVVIGERDSPLAREVHKRYLPDAVLVLADQGKGETLVENLLQGKDQVDRMTTVYVCENFVCQRPVTSKAELDKMLDS